MNDPTSHSPNLLLQQRAVYSHWVKDHIRWSDTDAAGHANNLSFAAFCETGRAHLLRRFLVKDADPRALFVLAEMTIKYIGEAHWPDAVDIATGVLSIGKSSVRMGQALFAAERCIAISESSLVLIDEDLRRSRPIPDFVRDWLANYSIARQTLSIS